MLVCIGIGITATIGFHILVKENANDIGELVDDKKDIKMEELALGMELNTDREVKYSCFILEESFFTFCLLIQKSEN